MKMTRGVRTKGVALWLLAWGLIGCDDVEDVEDEEIILARVGDREITSSHLRYFESRVAEGLKTKKTGIEGLRDHLQTLIDKEILLQEAGRLGLDQTPEVAGKLRSEFDERMLKAFVRREVFEKIAIDDEELLEYQRATGRDRAVVIGQIVVDTREEADEIASALRSGTDFDKLAGRTVLPREQQRLARVDLIKDQIDPPILQEIVFPLQKGEVSDIVDYSNQFGVYQILDEKEVQLRKVRSILEAELVKAKTPSMARDLASRLKEELGFRRNQEGLELLQQKAANGPDAFTDSESETVLYDIGDGKFTIRDFWYLATELFMGFAGGPEAVGSFTEEVVVPRILFLAAAYRAGIDREREMVEWRLRRRQSLLLVAIRQEAVSEVYVDEQEARDYYEKNPRNFSPLESVSLQEILVRTEGEAASLLEQIQAGADLGTLAQQHTLRRLGKGNEGKFHIHPFEKARFRELVDPTRGVEVGDLVGPVMVTVDAGEVLDPDPTQVGDRYYSVYRVLESTIGAAPEPFEKVGQRAQAMVRVAKQDRAFHQFLLELRHRYSPQIETYEDALASMAR